MSKQIRAMFPGSFNPIHKGHIDIIKRASKMFDKLYVVVSNNIYKKQDISNNKRVALVKKELAKSKLNNVEVVGNNGLTIDFAKKHNIKVIIRSFRNSKDAKYEIDMAKVNHKLGSDIETILMLPKENLINLSSSAIRYLKDAKGKK